MIVDPGDSAARVDPNSALHDFELDQFQLDAIDAIERGESVLVAAPTGSGKTVIAHHAIARAISRGGKAFYTTPIKALSNQKFHDLIALHGSSSVGLLTGDSAVNGDAPIVVMTTEVLRNMIYGQSPALEGLQCVVLDEVHYLQDAYRGPVWEEVIVHLPVDVRLVCLSATVSNAPELTEWISTARGPTATVLETRRPVELVNLYLVGDRQSETPLLIPALVDGQANVEGDRFDADIQPRGSQRRRSRWYTPRRFEVVEFLRERRLLPMMYFIFSRAGCDEAVTSCLSAGLRFTTSAERQHIRDIVAAHVAALSESDLTVLGYHQWLSGLEAGIAAHHAGMVPPFKEAVEACFLQGLVRVVFATETLSLGINMPARSVVVEKLTKFTGEQHEFLSAGQYTQLTGRAGRRGIDTEGTAVVLWSPFVPFGQVAGLAASRHFKLTSVFRPTYNMAANLVHRYPAQQAHHLLNLSFAQFQSDKEIVRLEAKLERNEAELRRTEAEATCHLGDIASYVAIATNRSQETGGAADAVLGDIILSLRPGDVVQLPGHRRDAPAVVLTVAKRKGKSVRIRVVTNHDRVRTLSADEFTETPEVIARLSLPVPFAPDDRGFQKDVGAELRLYLRNRDAHTNSVGRSPRRDGHKGRRSPNRQIQSSNRALHPVSACPDIAMHLRAARLVERQTTEVNALRQNIRGRSESLARRFDKVLQLLEAWGYLSGWSLTAKGNQLVKIFHESDLLIVESLEAGLFDGLDGASMAGLASCFTYEHRSSRDQGEPWIPSQDIRDRIRQIARLGSEINIDERRAGVPRTRPPDPGFAAIAYRWAAGEDLEPILRNEELSGGDFVRNTRILIDLLRQIALAAGNPQTARVARRAASNLFRGVVAASSVPSANRPGARDGAPSDVSGFAT